MGPNGTQGRGWEPPILGSPCLAKRGLNGNPPNQPKRAKQLRDWIAGNHFLIGGAGEFSKSSHARNFAGVG